MPVLFDQNLPVQADRIIVFRVDKGEELKLLDDSSPVNLVVVNTGGQRGEVDVNGANTTLENGKSHPFKDVKRFKVRTSGGGKDEAWAGAVFVRSI